jgi:predicted MarR family transcription regulator
MTRTARTVKAPVKSKTSQVSIPIVSSAHLATGARPELSELEYGLIVHSHAFQRWMTLCMSAAGVKEMSPMEILVIHHIVHRNRPKKIADICFVLNVEDTHIVTYALKKLESAGLVKRGKEGKEVVFSATEPGKQLCDRYRQVREQCLSSAVVKDGISGESLHEVATVLRMLSGIYDQAARAAASL